MKKTMIGPLLILSFSMILFGCQDKRDKESKKHTSEKKQLIEIYQSHIPTQWSEKVTGVKTRLHTQKKLVALTLDACGANKKESPGLGYDARLIEFLRREQVPATLFINSRWIDSNLEIFKQLSADPLFEIENHGTRHLPLSVVKGKEAHGIKATENIEEVIAEIQQNNLKIKNLTGYTPRFFRAGTAFYDEIAVKIAQDLGLEVAGYSLLGDTGASFTAQQTYQAFTRGIHPGAIILSHMNHPEKESSKGIIRAIQSLKAQGYSFVKLADHPLS